MMQIVMHVLLIGDMQIISLIYSYLRADDLYQIPKQITFGTVN